jgi:hypothetical protein
MVPFVLSSCKNVCHERLDCLDYGICNFFAGGGEIAIVIVIVIVMVDATEKGTAGSGRIGKTFFKKKLDVRIARHVVSSHVMPCRVWVVFSLVFFF